jgi:hypothetical protein
MSVTLDGLFGSGAAQEVVDDTAFMVNLSGMVSPLDFEWVAAGYFFAASGGRYSTNKHLLLPIKMTDARSKKSPKNAKKCCTKCHEKVAEPES